MQCHFYWFKKVCHVRSLIRFFNSTVRYLKNFFSFLKSYFFLQIFNVAKSSEPTMSSKLSLPRTINSKRHRSNKCNGWHISESSQRHWCLAAAANRKWGKGNNLNIIFCLCQIFNRNWDNFKLDDFWKQYIDVNKKQLMLDNFVVEMGYNLMYLESFVQQLESTLEQKIVPSGEVDRKRMKLWVISKELKKTGN